MEKKTCIRIGLMSILVTLLYAFTANAAFESTGNFFDDFDADGDGSVSQEEFTGPDDHFSNLDTNEDGLISADEGPTGPPEGDGNGPRGGGGGPDGDGPDDGGPDGARGGGGPRG